MSFLARHVRRAAASACVALVPLAAACAADESTGPADPAPGGGSAGATPAEAVGSWRYGTISPSNFWNDHTGQYSGNAYGISDQFVFAANGTYTQYTYIYTQSYGCQTQVWVEMAGVARFDAPVDGTAGFAKEVQQGRFKVSDTCSAARNYDRAMTDAERAARSVAHTFAVDAGSGRNTAVISGASYARVGDR